MISIVIPVRDRFEFIAPLLDSIICQKELYEIIIIDDGSKESLENFINQKYSLKYKIQRNEKPKGVSFSRNIGATISEGEYLIFLDSDDQLALNTLLVFEREINDESPDIIFGNLSLMSHEGSHISDDIVYYPSRIESIVDKWNLFLFGYSQLGAMCFKREFFEKVGGFNTDYYTWEDRDFFYRILLEDAKTVFVNDILLKWRQGEYQKLTSSAEKLLEQIKKEYAGDLGVWPKLIEDPFYPKYKKEFQTYFLSNELKVMLSEDVKILKREECKNMTIEYIDENIELEKKYESILSNVIIDSKTVRDLGLSESVVFELLTSGILKIVK